MASAGQLETIRRELHDKEVERQKIKEALTSAQQATYIDFLREQLLHLMKEINLLLEKRVGLMKEKNLQRQRENDLLRLQLSGQPCLAEVYSFALSVSTATRLLLGCAEFC